MKFTCTQENLARGLSTVSRVSGRNVTLPILAHTLIRTEKGQITLSATNLELAITVRIRGKIHEDGEYTAQARVFTEYVSLLDSEHVDVALEGTNLIVSGGTSTSKIHGAPTQEFPLIPSIERKNGVSITASDLRSALTRCTFSAALDESRPEISGVLFHLNGHTLTLAATDSYRLAEGVLTLKNAASAEMRAIVPTRTAQELLRLLTEDGEATLYFTENQLLFVLGDVELTSRLIEGQYPDYQPIIPKTSDTLVVTATSDLIQRVKAASLFCTPGVNDLTFQVDPEAKRLTMTTASSQLGEQVSELGAEVTGAATSITLNYRYLLDGLQALGSARVRLGLTTATNPALITPEPEDGYRYLVMPIRQ